MSLSPKKKSLIISLAITVFMLIAFYLMITEFSSWCRGLLLTVFIGPTITLFVLGYDGQSMFLIIGLILLEFSLLFWLLNQIVFAILSRKKTKPEKIIEELAEQEITTELQ